MLAVISKDERHILTGVRFIQGRFNVQQGVFFNYDALAQVETTGRNDYETIYMTGHNVQTQSGSSVFLEIDKTTQHVEEKQHLEKYKSLQEKFLYDLRSYISLATQSSASGYGVVYTMDFRQFIRAQNVILKMNGLPSVPVVMRTKQGGRVVVS